jgi:hypothetical protein
MPPQNRFTTSILALGVIVLLAAILLGEHMGDRVMTEAAEGGSLVATPIITPLPQPSDTGAYGPDWKNTQTLAAAPDPNFPDPRIPPKPLPTLAPSPTPSPTPKWTPNPNVPVWDQTPPPSPEAEGTTFNSDSTQASESPGPTATPPEKKKCRGVLRLLNSAGIGHPC